MKRSSLNFVIDAAAFAGFLLLATTGMLLAYRLPPGSGGREGYGGGRGESQRSIDVLWGFTRHEWGDVHYWLAIALMAVLALHLFLHWNWIVGVVRGKPSSASPLRLALGAVGLVSVVVLSALPLLGTTTSATRSELREEPMVASSVESIRGSMTLEHIAAETGTTVAFLVREMQLPADTDPNAKAGRLLRDHGLEMSDLRRTIESNSTLQDR
jgi:hypothetical protein